LIAILCELILVKIAKISLDLKFEKYFNWIVFWGLFREKLHLIDFVVQN
jgi:hypothetical protein